MSQFLEKQPSISCSRGSMVPEYSNFDELELQFAQDEEREKLKSVAGADSFKVGTPGNENVVDFKRKGKGSRTHEKALNFGEIEKQENELSMSQVLQKGKILQSEDAAMSADDFA